MLLCLDYIYIVLIFKMAILVNSTS